MARMFFAVLFVLLLTATAFAKVNINTATPAELEKLPGVGPAKAEAIVQYRKEHGNFKTAEELKNVKGIGDKMFEKISAEVEVGK